MTPSKPSSELNNPEATVAYSPNGALHGDEVRHLQAVRNAAADAQAMEAVRTPLRARLRLAFLLLTSVFGFAGCLGVANVALQPEPVPPRVWHGLAFFAGPTLALIALTVLLWSRRPLSLVRLRAIELVLVGLFALACVWKQLSYLDAAPDLARRFGAGGTTILAGYHGAFWFALLALYGLFVPNTWRRCTIVAGLIAVCPLVVALVASGRADGPPAGRPFHYYVAALAFWSGFGALLAVFGSQHIARLRQQVSAAQQLGPYQLTKRLGAGGMGEVYLAEHRLLRRPCAVKFIGPAQLGDPRSLHRFEEEVQATAALTHPNTVEIYDYGHTEDGTFYYVMEYLPGLSLDELVLRHGPVPPGRAVFLLRQVCDALHEAHAAGLIHRDVKPGNILVCQRGGLPDVAKLLDFGLVQTAAGNFSGDEAAAGRGIVGTPAYLSPEQAAGLPRLDARSDLYSLGAVAYFLLTGQPPFVGESVLQVLASHRSVPARFPSPFQEQLPADLQAIVLRCLEKDPTDRFAAAEELEQALATCSCTGTWTRGEAARWWQKHAVDQGRPPSQERQPTRPA